MSLIPKIKIFVSHHNSDAGKLSMLRKYLLLNGFQCFLAKQIRPGDDYIKKLLRELKNCNGFLYIGGKAANASAYCQQEIGFALGQQKKIIATMTPEHPPPGFINGTFAFEHEKFDHKFCHTIHKLLSEKFPMPDELKKHLQILKIDGFSLEKEKNKIHLIANDTWNDFAYQTAFMLFVNDKEIGKIKIGYKNQLECTHTFKKLPRDFKFLYQPFFSRVRDNDIKSEVLNTKQILSLKYLLNDIEYMPKIEKDKIVDDKMYNKSLLRKPYWA